MQTTTEGLTERFLPGFYQNELSYRILRTRSIIIFHDMGLYISDSPLCTILKDVVYDEGVLSVC